MGGQPILKQAAATWSRRGPWLLRVSLLAAAVVAINFAAADVEKIRRFEIPVGARDASAGLTPFMDGEAFDGARIDSAFAGVRGRVAGVRFVLMPSYLSDFLELPHRIGLLDYFGAQDVGLRAEGFTVERAPIDSEASIWENANTLRRVVAGSDRPVCILSHSKGGLDTLEFLIKADQALLDKVACWISFQAPFAGSPVADEVSDVGLLKAAADVALSVFGGSGRSLDNLRTADRARYLKDHDAAIVRIAAQVPILAVAGAVDDPGLIGGTATPSYPALVWMRGLGIRSDGVVPTNSAILPHAPFVRIAELDHSGFVLSRGFGPDPEDRIRFTKLMLVLALSERPL